jgi:isoleucyl-tRNA synthetase
LSQSVTHHLDAYEFNEAMRLFAPFLDTLNNWYIRRSRERAWAEDRRDPEKLSFFSTLYDVLTRVAQLLAPFCPFIAEAVWERLLAPESVHLSSWPAVRTERIDAKLSTEINLVRAIVSAGLSVRSREKLRVRLPLTRAQVVLPDVTSHVIKSYQDVICSELNVKSVDLLADHSSVATLSAKVNARVLGPRLGGRVQEVIKLIREGTFTVLGEGRIRVEDIELGPGEVELVFVGKEGCAVEAGSGFVVALDTTITEALTIEGQARDLVRAIQDLRKEADLKVSDRIVLSVVGAEQALNLHRDFITKETLCMDVVERLESPRAEKKVEIDELTVTIRLNSVS